MKEKKILNFSQLNFSFESGIGNNIIAIVLVYIGYTGSLILIFTSTRMRI